MVSCSQIGWIVGQSRDARCRVGVGGGGWGIAGEAGVAETPGSATDRSAHAVHGEIAERLDAQMAADRFEVMGGGNQLVTGGRVDAVMTRAGDRRGGHAEVNLLRT